MLLLIDAGNTRVKWAQADGADLRVGAPVAHADTRWPETLAACWLGIARPEEIWIAAVASTEVVAALREACAIAFPAVPVHELESPAQACGVRNGYAEPQRLGVDRFMALVAAHARAPGPLLVVGCGTACAIDALAADGEHLGGLILPSARTMQQAVLAATARVEQRAPGGLAPFGRSTEDGLVSGSWRALAATVSDARERLAAIAGEAPRVLLHGGDAHMVAALLQHESELVPDLVLEGIARCAADRGS